MVSHRNLPERKNPLLEPTDATAGMYTLHRVISASHLTVVRSRDSHRETSTRTDKPRCKARRQWPYQCDQAGEHGHVRLRAFEGSIAKATATSARQACSRLRSLGPPSQRRKWSASTKRRSLPRAPKRSPEACGLRLRRVSDLLLPLPRTSR